MRNKTRAEVVKGQGRRATAYELTLEALEMIDQARESLNADGTIPHCSRVQALEILIREGFKRFKEIP